MIVTIASTQGQSLASRLAANLAVLRARSGRKICLIDADPRSSAYGWSCERSAAGQGPSVPARKLAGRLLPHEIESLASAYSDFLINTGERDTQESRSALIAARMVIVPVETGQANLESQYALIARLNFARMSNPCLKVLFVVVAGSKPPTGPELATVRRYVAHVMSASLAATMIHDPRSHEYGSGRCVCDAETCDPDAAAEMHALYREIYPH
ncbi:hypothetical protein [Telluria aromaticivorans]|uniref:CobQ/CobB/MinD/ParA nucleotide binding domain-containing protein n=1 Tax=Telluria aromaticivorans TaxID=2725995 RepID=A0A7Y2K2J7_9BURK|nr:hypothetical protein [Telluria aromaticivorans]NNG25386.1 hypothetical protein [Telluria aromaticivorans]